MDCLRRVNYLCRPSEVAIQALLLATTVLQNEGHLDAAWALHGTTTRLVQNMRLREAKDVDTSVDDGSRSELDSLEKLW